MMSLLCFTDLVLGSFNDPARSIAKGEADLAESIAISGNRSYLMIVCTVVARKYGVQEWW